MYCINYGSFDYGQGRSGRLSQKLRPNTQRSSLVRTQYLLFPCGILTDVRTSTLPSQAIDTSLIPAELIADYVIDREAFIARPYVPFLLTTL
jgi:hypothetical protein